MALTVRLFWAGSRRPRASRSTAAGSIRRCADGWLPRARQDFMLEVLPPCYESGRIFRGSAAVKTQRPIITDDEHVVLKFRPRTSAHPPGRHEAPAPTHILPATNRLPAANRLPEANRLPGANDLSRYERPREEPHVIERARELADTKYSYEAYLERTRQACATLFGLQGDEAANASRRPVPDKEPVVKDLA